MMTQEEYIAEEFDYRPATVSKRLRDGGPPRARTIDHAEAGMTRRWAARITQLTSPPANKLLATSVFEIIRAEVFEGSYPSVVSHLRARRGPRFRSGVAVSVPIETAPGEEARFEFSDCGAWKTLWGLGNPPVLGRHRRGGRGGSPPPSTPRTPSRGWRGSSRRPAAWPR